jgi:8-oxo-dGTP pyrophosphatase MutT (NUDIX family)
MDEKLIQKIKERLTQPLPGPEAQFQMAPSFRLTMNKTTVTAKAGVLLLLYPKSNEWNIIFMKRPDYEGTHGGQISFPGGKFDPPDENLLETALRETKEEIGVPAITITMLGPLSPLYIPVSEYEVYPFIGFCDSMPEFKIDPHEVDYLIEARVIDLLNPSTRMKKRYSSDRVTGTVPYFNLDGNEVWGATAMILNEFLALIAD